VISGLPETDAEFQSRFAAFRQSLRQLGWLEGRNVRIDFRDASSGDTNGRKVAADLVAAAPDLVLTAGGGANLAALQETTRTIPIVFVLGIDPVGAGFR